MCVKRLVISFLLLAFPFLIHAQDMVTSGQRDGISKSVRYDVEKFTDTRDRKLEDVLDKLPGMSKWEWNGGVNLWYNGAWVQKIYINGKDILNQETYNYTLVDSDTFSKSYTSYMIRPRNVLLSVFHKF